MDSQCKCWLLTIFGELSWKPPKNKFCIWQKEKCPKTGKLHLQVYIEFGKQIRFIKLQEILPVGTHIEMRKGTREDAIKYCSKQDTRVEGPWEEGTRENKQGERNDLNELKGKKIEEVIETNYGAFIKFHKGIEKALLLSIKPRDFQTELYILWGAAGTGKTRYVFDNEKDIYMKPEGMWFDGYIGQEVALFDDFNPEDISITLLLKLADRYPMMVPIKGGFVQWRPKRLYITSNIFWVKWYDYNEPLLKALKRRITKEWEVKMNDC